MKSQNYEKFNRTQESIFTLLSLSILTVQAFESITGKEDILNAEFNASTHVFKDLINDTIREALIYQILLKSCSYLDEWDKVFGVKTEEEDLPKILMVKRIVKPAYKCVTSWKQLREFRNQAIAHNHRDKNGNNIYLNQNTWDSPQSDREIFLLVYCIKSMTDILNFYFPEVAEMIVLRGNKFEESGSEDIDLNERIRALDLELSENLRKNGAFDNL